MLAALNINNRLSQFFFFPLIPFILGEVGFLAEDRRINVAVTRARRHIAVVCDTQTVQNHGFLKSLIDHMTEFGEVRTAFEYIQDIVPQNYTRDHKDAKTASSSTSTSTKHKVKDQPSSKAKPGQKKSAGSSSKENAAGSEKQTKSSTSAEQEQSKGRRTEIREQVERFMKDLNQSELQFPSLFNSHDRLLVHEIAEELGLIHESKGEGSERCITVSRPPVSKPAKEEARAATEEEEETIPDSKSEPSSQPPLDLKSLHLERMKREQKKREENAQQKKQQNNIHPAQGHSSKKAKGLHQKSLNKAFKGVFLPISFLTA